MHLTHEDASCSHDLTGQTDAHRSVKFAMENVPAPPQSVLRDARPDESSLNYGPNGSQPFDDQGFRDPLRVVWSVMTCIKAVVSGPISVAARPPMDQMETEDSEVPVSELYHSSETREHEFAEELVAVADVKEGINSG